MRNGIPVRWLMYGCAAIAALLPAWPAAGQEAAPATAAAPAPAPQAATATAPSSELPLPTMPSGENVPIAQASTVDQALEYGEDEQLLLKDVQDADGQLSAPALYVLLRRVMMLPPGEAAWNEATQPNPKDLWREPQFWRGKLIRLYAYYGHHEPIDWSRGLARTRWWGDRQVWLIGVKDPKTGRGMIVMSPNKPPPHLRRGSTIQFAGLFYKTVMLDAERPDETKAGKEEYPVIVVRSLVPDAQSPAAAGGGWRMPSASGMTTIMFLIVAALLILLFAVRRLGGRSRAGPQYRPHRLGPGQAGPLAPPAPEEPLDDELLRQVRQYKKEHPENDQRSR